MPTSWYKVWELVDAIERDSTGGDFWVVYGPLNQAVNTMNVPFPRDFG